MLAPFLKKSTIGRWSSCVYRTLRSHLFVFTFNQSGCTRAEKYSMGNQSRPESRQESRSARIESRIGSDPNALSYNR